MIYIPLSFALIIAAFSILLTWLVVELIGDKERKHDKATIRRLHTTIGGLHETIYSLRQENRDAYTLVVAELGATEIKS